jgi:hypothetical protein
MFKITASQCKSTQVGVHTRCKFKLALTCILFEQALEMELEFEMLILVESGKLDKTS